MAENLLYSHQFLVKILSSELIIFNLRSKR